MAIYTKFLPSAVASESERRSIKDEAIKSIAPRLIVRPSPTSRLAFRQDFDEKPGLIAICIPRGTATLHDQHISLA